MQPAAPEISICPGCGRALEETSGGGLGCMVCLLRVGISGEDERDIGISADHGATETFEGDEHFGVYEIDRREDGSFYELGHGAMGVTYRATDTSLQRKVALKIIKLDVARGGTEARERFLREARVAAALRHENIATVFQFGIREETGQCFYAMELIEGETLEEHVRRAGPFDVRTSIRIAQQVTAALIAAEKRGLIHRDLKPANLMLVDADEVVGTDRRVVRAVQRTAPTVKIIDFGLAKVLNAPVDPARLTHDGFVGTPAFASPEQFENSALDARSDIYSLGATLWFTLTGKTPFGGHTVEEIRRAQRSNALPIEQLKAARVPRRLRSLLKSTLAAEPAARPGTRDLAARLRNCATRASPESIRGTRLALAAALIVILGASAFFISRSQRIHPAAADSASNAVVPDKSVAVLPFENLSRDPDNAFFADGMQDEILTNLARIGDLKVISRASVLQYKAGVVRNLREIGNQLGVAHLLEGSVQRAANRVRVNAKLIDARTDAHLWAQTYDRDLADVFAIQSEIAKAIADQLQATLSPNEKAAIEKPPTADLAAFDLYTRAKTLLLTTSFIPTGEQNLRQAIELLNQAATRDPGFFEAYYQLAFAHGRLYSLGFDHTANRLASADAALQTAIRLRPDAGETHLARANYLYYGPRDYAGALAELENARQSLPNHPRLSELTGYILRRRGQQEEGLRNLQKAIELDPRNYFIMQQIALSYQFLRRYPEEAAILDRALTIIPKDAATKVNRALVEFYWKADTKPLHQAIDSVLAEDPGAIAKVADSWLVCALAERDPVAAERALVALGDNPWLVDAAVILSPSFGEGLLARLMNDEAKARAAFSKARAEQEKIVQAQPDYGPALCILGLIDAALGLKEAALQEARRAVELLPVENDSINGSHMIQYFAITAAWTGEKDLALQQLELGARAPTPSQVLNYGALQLLPFWDPLRGDPRFKQIVGSLAPGLGAKSAPDKSVAVLPFEDLSDEKEHAFFADGIHDDILTKLAKVADLKVISRTSVMQYRGKQDLRQIAGALGVSHVLEGTVRRSGSKVHINAQLVDACTDTHEWAEEYDRDLNDVFAIEAELAQSIATQLRARISAGEDRAMQERPTSDLVAYELYTRARSLVLTASSRSTGRTDLLQAVDLLNQAVTRDPSFLQAYCQLASAHDHLYSLGFDRTPARLELANAAIQTAFHLRPDAGETHLARAENLYRGYVDYGGALADLEVARQTLPNDARILLLMGFIQRRQGRWQVATQNMERAVELDPRNTYTLQQMAWQYLFVRRYAEVKSLLAHVLAIEPSRVDTQVFLASVDFHWKADIRPFHQTIDSIRTTNPSALPGIVDAWLTCALAERDPSAAANAMVALGENAFGDDTVHFSRAFIEGVVARMMKDEGKARSAFITARSEQEKIVRAQPNYGPPLCVLGLIDAGLGRKDQALREGRHAVELLPMEKDAINGTRMIKYLAMIAAWVGDNDVACQQLTDALRYPSSPSYGDLKLLPFWDPLRDDPRFEKIVASLAPK